MCASLSTGEVELPAGTENERPTGATGMLRFNSDTTGFEGYNGSQWTGIGGGNPWASTSSSITVAANDRYFVDTSGGAKTITLPASPAVGDEVTIIDSGNFAASNNITIGRNSSNINGNAGDLVISTNSAAFTLVYANSARGWVYKTTKIS